MIVQLNNCQNCRDGNHDVCSWPDRCRCANYKHSDNLLIGVKLDKEKQINKEFFQDVKEVNEEIKHELKSYENDDFDLVADLIQENDTFVTLRENEKIWHYDKKENFYKPHGETIIKEKSQKLIKKCKRNTRKEIIDHIISNGTYIPMLELLESKHINTQNGILDPNTFELKDHSPEYLTISKLPFSINYDANNFKLWRHILTIIAPKDINLIIELIWICISWNNPFKKMFVFKGESNTQKSTLADIIAWIIGNDNVSRQKPESFLLKGSRFGTSKFIGKRINIASEIGNLTEEELENQKSLIGAEIQNTERKNDNNEYRFDPNHFVFLYTTNKLGSIYSSINDNSVITRFQFLIFRNKIEDDDANGQWYDEFFKDNQDKQTAIDTLVRVVIAYKKSQVLGKTPKTKWSSIAQTKEILKEQMPLVDKYFEDERIISKDGVKLTLAEIKQDFESYTNQKFTSQKIGYILKNNNIKSSTSNGVTFYKGYSFNTEKDQTRLTS